MTIIQAVNEADNLKPNMYELPEKIKWLSRLDRRIFDNILCTHVLSEEEQAPYLQEDGTLAFSGYTEEDQDRELIVGEPHDEIYVHWLSAQIDKSNMEYLGFNNNNALFESVYREYRNAFNRDHMPLSAEKTYF